MTNRMRILVLLAAASLVAACDTTDAPDQPPAPTPVVASTTMMYDVTVTNLTYGQPFSPAAAVLHDGSYTPWTMGSAATGGLEQLAESGDNSVFLNEADAAGAIGSASGTGIIMPGAGETFSIVVDGDSGSHVSVATMLVNTNDAFAGFAAVDISGLGVGSSWTGLAPIYDAGTEANSAAAGTIPGPEDGGEGYNVARNDIDIVTRHPGVWVGDALSEAARFDGPVARVTITRAQ